MAEPVTHLLIVHAHEVTEDAERFMLGLPKENVISPVTRSIK